MRSLAYNVWTVAVTIPNSRIEKHRISGETKEVNYWTNRYERTRENDKIIDIILCSPLYRVLPNGTIETKISKNGLPILRNWRPAETRDGDGYRVLNVTIEKGTKTDRRGRKKLRSQRVVYRALVGNLDPTKVINHKNGIKQDNRPENLELVTPEYNSRHAFEVLKQSPIKNFVLSYEIAEEIRQMRKIGHTYSEICKRYGISKGHVSEIVNGKIWKQNIHT